MKTDSIAGTSVKTDLEYLEPRREPCDECGGKNFVTDKIIGFVPCTCGKYTSGVLQWRYRCVEIPYFAEP
jgi:hypothetical protein